MAAFSGDTALLWWTPRSHPALCWPAPQWSRSGCSGVPQLRNQVSFTAYVGQTKVPAQIMVSQFEMIQTEQPKNGGVQVVQVNTIVDGPQTDLVRRADGLAAFHAATSHPYREAIRIVIAPRAATID